MCRTLDSPLVRALLAASGDGVIVWGHDLEVVAWNRAAERLFGCSEADALATPLSRFFAGELPLTPTSSPDGDIDIDIVGVRADGGRVALSIRVSPMHAPGGTLEGGVLCARPRSTPTAADPSDTNAERLNLALIAARLGDWSWDASTDVVTFSARAAEIFGTPGTQITWTALRDRLHPDDREGARLAVEHSLTHHRNYSVEYRVMDGTREHWVAASGHGRYDREGRVLGMFGMVQDITDDRLLVRLDDAVRPLVKSEDITYTAARILGQHLDVNRCAYAFVEADEDTFILTGNYTHGSHSIVGRYRFRQFGAECLRLMRAGLPYVVDDSRADPRIDADDRVAYGLTSIRSVVCVPISKSGRFVAAMAVHMLTPRQWSESEVELVQRVASRCWESIERARVESEREALLEAAETANRAKDEFLAMLGHELRNPLAPILTALQLMKLQNDTAFPRERTVIERQVRHLTRMVDDLLDVSRIARGKVVLDLELIEIATIVQRSLEVASPLLEARGHGVVVDVPASGLCVEADPERLTQILSNLLTNACKYTAPAGRIVISARLDGDQIILSVADNGMGISADALPQIFDLFVQGRQALDRARGGLGLGLAIVRSLVERHGGSVFARSAGQDQGSEFVVRLPRARAGAVERPSKQPDAPSPPESCDARVLVVDDNVDAAELLAAALKLRGCEVQVAHDGPQALELAARSSFDIALLDIGLPVIDGYELAARLRQLSSFQGVRLVAVTGYGQPADRERALAAGFDQHLVKPVDLQVLEALVAKR